MDREKAAITAQQQATAAWIGYLHQVRIERLLAAMQSQDANLERALDTLDEVRATVTGLLSSNRGGDKGLHGFIAETVDSGFRNSRAAVEGLPKPSKWLNDNGPADLLQDGVLIQQKFSRGGGAFSLNAAFTHLQRYPDFIRDGGRYQIPSDHYDAVARLLKMSERQASLQLPDADGLTMRQWRLVHRFFDTSGMAFEDFERSVVGYDDIQIGTVNQTLFDEETLIRQVDEERRRGIAAENASPFGDITRVAVGAAAAESALSAGLVIVCKLRKGTKLTEFSEDDWGEVCAAGGSGVAKGGIRGISVYTLTKVLSAPPAAANALASATIGIISQAHRLRSGEITELEFIEESQVLAIDSALSALGAALGQAVIPVPLLGAVIGDLVTSVITQTARDYLGEAERVIVDELVTSLNASATRLAEKDAALVSRLNENLKVYLTLLSQSNSLDPSIAFEASARLALATGVDPHLVLDSAEKRDAYFLK